MQGKRWSPIQGFQRLVGSNQVLACRKIIAARGRSSGRLDGSMRTDIERRACLQMKGGWIGSMHTDVGRIMQV